MRTPLACFLTARIHPVRDERDSQQRAYVQTIPRSSPGPGRPYSHSYPPSTLYSTPSSCPGPFSHQLSQIFTASGKNTPGLRTLNPVNPVNSVRGQIWFSPVAYLVPFQQCVSSVTCPDPAYFLLWTPNAEHQGREKRESRPVTAQMHKSLGACLPSTHTQP